MMALENVPAHTDSKVSQTDPDASPMKHNHWSRARLGYHTHYVVDGVKALPHLLDWSAINRHGLGQMASTSSKKEPIGRKHLMVRMSQRTIQGWVAQVCASSWLDRTGKQNTDWMHELPE
jgi:hypothetical protein